MHEQVGFTKGFKRPILKVLALICGLSVLCLLAGSRYLQHQLTDLRMEAEANLAAVTDLKTRQVDGWLQERRADGNEMLHADLIQKQLQRYLEGSSWAPSPDVLTSWLNVFRKGMYKNVVLFDAEGRCRLGCTADAHLAHPEHRKHIQSVLDTGQVFLTDIERDPITQKSHMALWIPIGAAAKPAMRAMGALYLEIDPSATLSPMLQNWPYASQSGESLLVRKEGAGVLYLSPPRSTFGKDFNPWLPAKGYETLPAHLALVQREGVVSGKDYRGVPVVAVAKAIPGTSWIMLAKVDEAEVYGPAKQRTRVLFGSIFALLLAMVLGIAFFTHARESAILQKELAQEQQIARLSRLYAALSQVNQSITREQTPETLYTKICEIMIEFGHFHLAWIGLKDASGTRVDIIHQHGMAGEVLQTLDLNCREATPSLVGTAIRTGKPIVINDCATEEEDLSWREAATRHDIASAVIVPFQKGGQVCGVLCVCDARQDIFGEIELSLLVETAMDISFALDHMVEEDLRRAAEQALKTSELLLQRGQEAGKLSTYALDLQQDHWVCSPILERILGIDETYPRTRQSYLDLIPGTHQDAMLHHLQDVIAQHTHLNLEHPILRPLDQQVRWVQIQGEIERDATGQSIRLIGVIQDITERKQAERERAELETLFNLFLEHCPAYVYFKDHEGRYLLVSRNFEHVMDRPLEAILGKRADEIFSPAVAERVRWEDEKILRDGVSISCEELLNGRFYTTVKFPVVREEGEPFLAGFTLDITERKTMEEALVESESRFRAIFEHAVVGVADLAPDGHFHRANPAFQTMMGYSEAELREMTFLDISHPDNQAADKQAILECLEGTRTHYATEKRYVTKTGELLWGSVHASLVRDTSGNPRNFIAVVQDITLQKQAEFAIRESEEKFRSLFETMTEGVALHEVVRDAQGRAVDYRLLNINPAYEKQTGLPMARARGALASHLYGTGDSPYLELFTHVAESGEPCAFEAYVAPLARHFRVRVCSPRPDTFATIFEDITTQKQAEEERLRMEAHIQQSQRLESLGLLAGGVAHDMNNVLGAILSLASTLRERSSGPGDLATSMDTIINACMRGRNVVRSLLSFARKDLEETRPVDLNALIEDLVQLLSHTTLKRIKFAQELQDSIGLIQGDVSVLSHALMNLCVNAMDAMPQGGTITLRTRRNPDNDQVEISVRDTGEGMAPDVLAKAIEPFFTTKEKGKGTGLGLAMVYGTMNAHGGTMELQSQPGQGTEVTLFFPGGAMEKMPEPTEHVQETTTEPQTLRILLVDDDELIRESVSPLLETLGHTVSAAASGMEALGILEQGTPFDVVILDINMPDMDGGETLRRLLLLRPQQTVLLSTGYSDLDTACLQEGRPNVSIIRKPFGLRDLRDKLLSLSPNGPA